MEHLTKQQIVLLTLFTSFVTSIATGIVTVALVDQAPATVTGTVNHVIERTIEEIVPPASTGSGGSAQSASASNAAASAFSDPADQIAAATAIGQQSVVRIMLGNNVTGLGVVAASSGIIIADKSSVAMPGNYVAISSTGAQYPLQVIQKQNNGDVVFLLAGPVVTPGPAPATSRQSSLVPATFASLAGPNAPLLGETVIALSNSGSGIGSAAVSEGIIQKINMTPDSNGIVDASSTIASFSTSIDSPDITVGSALFDANGNLLGMKTLSNLPGNFYPIGYLEAMVPAL